MKENQLSLQTKGCLWMALREQFNAEIRKQNKAEQYTIAAIIDAAKELEFEDLHDMMVLHRQHKTELPPINIHGN